MTPADGVAWVTGASSGIGRAAALELARRGWTVCASARREAELETLAAEATELPGRIVGHPLDVTESTATAEVIAAIERVHGPVALAFLNAGVAPYLPAGELDFAAFRQALEVNVLGVLNGFAPLLERMQRRGRGHLAVNASLAGYRGLPKGAAYSTSKAAVLHLCEALKFHCDRAGVRLQVVSPGFVDTALIRDADFSPPLLLAPELAARRIVDGFERGGFEIALPLRMALALKLMRALPYAAYFPLMALWAGQRSR